MTSWKQKTALLVFIRKEANCLDKNGEDLQNQEQALLCIATELLTATVLNKEVADMPEENARLKKETSDQKRGHVGQDTKNSILEPEPTSFRLSGPALGQHTTSG